MYSHKIWNHTWFRSAFKWSKVFFFSRFFWFQWTHKPANVNTTWDIQNVYATLKGEESSRLKLGDLCQFKFRELKRAGSRRRHELQKLNLHIWQPKTVSRAWVFHFCTIAVSKGDALTVRLRTTKLPGQWLFWLWMPVPRGSPHHRAGVNVCTLCI